MMKKDRLIDMKIWHNRGENWLSLIFSFIKYPAYLGAMKFLFPWLPYDNYFYFALGIGLAIGKLLVGYLDYKKGVMLRESERATEAYNPYFNKLKSSIETLDGRVKNVSLILNETLKELVKIFKGMDDKHGS